jgi:hypothetical protein
MLNFSVKMERETFASATGTIGEQSIRMTGVIQTLKSNAVSHGLCEI